MWTNVHLQLQWKPLNVITLVQFKTDNINRLIIITDFSVHWKKMNCKKIGTGKSKCLVGTYLRGKEISQTKLINRVW